MATRRRAQGRPRRRPATSPRAHHAEWIRLLEVSGPFLEIPVLTQVFPQGLPALDPGLRAGVRQRFDEWMADGARDRSIHSLWLGFVLRDVLGFPDAVLRDRTKVAVRFDVHLPQHRTNLGPDFVVVQPATGDSPECPRLLVQTHPPEQRLDRPVPDQTWKAAPVDRMVELLRGQDHPMRLGLVTNGSEWTLVHLHPGEATSYVTWKAELWGTEPLTLQAFRELLGVQRTVGAADDDRLERLFERSATTAHELTDQLGLQVRQAVERLVKGIDDVHRARQRQLLKGVDDKQLYEAAVTVMMRLVFVFYAEENRLLPLDDPFYQQHYALSPLRDQLSADRDRLTDDVLQRRHAAWCRLLATFRAVHGGVEHEAMRLLAYGGALFDPDRFPFLEGREPTSKWRDVPANPLEIDDLTVLQLLESLQLVEVAGAGTHRERRPLSFRALDVEQIGHVYEGLLDHTAVRARGPVLGLVGKRGAEPEVELEDLEAIAGRPPSEFTDRVAEWTGKSAAQVSRLRGLRPVDEDPDRWQRACDGDQAMLDRIAPFAGLVREEHGAPVVFPPGSVYVTKGSDRRSTGTHYTPRSLTEPIVRHALDPLVYEGPAEGWPEEKWRLRSPREILRLKVCDMTVGSGAFLVQACRYLADKLVESWAEVEAAHEGQVLVSPEGELALASAAQRPLPKDDEERLAIARRAVVDGCLYGVDVNPMAVEMAKLSLWLVTLQKDRPFTFLDHAIRCGDALLGVHDVEQVAWFHLDPERGQVLHKWKGGVQAMARKALAEATELRTRLEGFAVLDVCDADRKRDLLARAQELVGDLMLAADLLVGIGLQTADKNAREFDDQVREVARDVATLLDVDDSEDDKIAVRAKLVVERGRLLTLESGQPTCPFHWALEFPELASTQLCVVGNPPYVGNKYWKTRLTEHQRRALHLLLGPSPGKIDAWVGFLRRAMHLVGHDSCLALLGPSSAAEGDAIAPGLGHLADHFFLYRALPTFSWPGQASTFAIAIWASRSPSRMTPVLSDSPAIHIAGDLTDRPPIEPSALPSGADWFQGVDNSRGLALVMLPDDGRLQRLQIAGSPYLRAYITGDDITSIPPDAVPRWCIDCGDETLEQVEARCPATHQFLIEHVLPTRSPQSLASYAGLSERWWQFWNTRARDYGKLRVVERCFVIPNVAKHVICASRDSSSTYTNQVYLHANTELQAMVVHSTLFQDWVETWSGTMGVTVRVKLTRAVRTFPLPSAEQPRAPEWPNAARTWCLERRCGYTELFNRICDRSDRDPAVDDMRQLLAEADAHAMAAYGWSDPISHDFVRTRFGIRFRLAPELRTEVLRRLIALNQQGRAREVRDPDHPRIGTQRSLFDSNPPKANA